MSPPQRLTGDAARAALPPLTALLQDSVHHGASVGFLAPLSAEAATAYWHEIIAEVDRGTRVLLAIRDDVEVVGSVQLSLCQRPNGQHRAEVQKLLVHTRARRRGLARILMGAAEAEALGAGRTLLYLDTEPDQPAESMYVKFGWIRAGVIPGYALNPSGELHGTAIFYKALSA